MICVCGATLKISSFLTDNGNELDIEECDCGIVYVNGKLVQEALEL